MSAEAFVVSRELDQLFERIGVLSGRRRDVSELSGGLTNANYRVQTDDGGDFVVRVSESSAGLLAINRENERFNTRAAGEAGVGARVIEALPEAGVLVVEFLSGRTLDTSDLRDLSTLPRIATAVRRLHDGSAFQGSFDMRQIRRRYLDVVQERGYRLPDGYLDLQPLIEGLEDAMGLMPERLVPCNNDLLPANFIDDGSHIWIIDYEYSGMNEASFELGNISSESFLNPEQTRVLVSNYWGRDSEHKVARAQAWSLLARYGWTLWASIQDGASSIDFDFWSWGMLKYDSAREELHGPQYQQVLKGLAVDD